GKSPPPATIVYGRVVTSQIRRHWRHRPPAGRRFRQSEAVAGEVVRRAKRGPGRRLGGGRHQAAASLRRAIRVAARELNRWANATRRQPKPYFTDRAKLIELASAKYLVGHETSPIPNPRPRIQTSIWLSKMKSSPNASSGASSRICRENARYPV